jgi:hypothetical protein
MCWSEKNSVLLFYFQQHFFAEENNYYFKGALLLNKLWDYPLKWLIDKLGPNYGMPTLF